MTALPSHPAELPAYQALFAADVKDFSGRPGRDHAALTEQLPQIVAAAFAAAGLAEIWERQTFRRVVGDEIALGFPATVLPLLLNPLLGALQAELVDGPVRMRVSVHVGPVTGPGTTAISDGSGAARVEAHRLLDSDAVKELLTRSDDITSVAAIVSERAVADAVATAYSAESLSLYVPVEVRVKGFRGKAHLRVPAPSGDLLLRGFGTPDTAPSPLSAAVATPHPATGTVIGYSSGAVQTGSGRQVNHFGNRRDR